jgi:hypothetical protein
MSTRSKLIVAAAIAALSFSSPAFAQVFSGSLGTGNVQPSYYDSNGGLHEGTATQQNQIAVHRSGLSAFARVPHAARSYDNPAATNGVSMSTACLPSDSPCRTKPDQW